MGNTGSSKTPESGFSVHPHVHGEHIKCKGMATGNLGSSPRTWGTPGLGLKSSPILRFIPTYMGNTDPILACELWFKVHPHVHGEHAAAVSPAPVEVGSSPRTWGTPPSPAPSQGGLRFIPTYMGNTQPDRGSITTAAVHPHVHGEHGPDTVASSSEIGSSPRTWGTLESEQVGIPSRRFIPTYMGNTVPFVAPVPPVTVHPHVHGEHSRTA